MSSSAAAPLSIPTTSMLSITPPAVTLGMAVAVDRDQAQRLAMRPSMLIPSGSGYTARLRSLRGAC